MNRAHGGDLMSVADPLPYTSPLKKLVRFFQRSRDQWKEKCQTAKRENNSLKIRLAAMKESRDRWREKAKQLETEQLEFDVLHEVRVTKKPR
jgi:hypothetical protein